MHDIQEQALSAAEGYLALGLYEEAHAELDLADLIPELRMEVTVRRMDLFLLEHRWKDAAIYGEALCDLDPDEPEYFLNYAFALQQLGNLDRAIGILLEGPEPLQDDPRYHYRLGACEAAAGCPSEAIEHLTNAIARDPSMHKAAIEDPVLKSLRNQLPSPSARLPGREPLDCPF